MSDSQKFTINPKEIRTFILQLLRSRLDDKVYQWIQSYSNNLLKDWEEWEFYSSFSAVPRYVGKNKLKLSDEEQQMAQKIRSGWEPQEWTVDEISRTLLVLSIAEGKKEKFLDTLDKTFISSDIGEAIALYKSLAVLPYPNALQNRAVEGIRSNMTSLFNAMALDNPYPADYFGEGAWNQLVLKALFVGSPLYKIQGIDRRRNKKLANMLVDYAHERWAADRSVSPELWRPVGPFADGVIIQDLKKVLDHPDKLQNQAAILALSESSSDKAKSLINSHKSMSDKVNNQITWDEIGRKLND